LKVDRLPRSLLSQWMMKGNAQFDAVFALSKASDHPRID